MCERALMARYCDGDAAAFRALYARLAPKILAYLMRLGRGSTPAADLLQQTFLKVHRARAAYVRGADPVSWVFEIAEQTRLGDLASRG